MRWYVMALCAGILMGAEACGPIAGGPLPTGQLAFQKDSTCADTTNTELFVDGVSQGQFTMQPSSIEGFTKSADTHIASATELAGKLRTFGPQSVLVPVAGVGTFLMTCASHGPPGSRRW